MRDASLVWVKSKDRKVTEDLKWVDRPRNCRASSHRDEVVGSCQSFGDSGAGGVNRVEKRI